MKIECMPITKDNEAILTLPNEPFLQEGRVIPIYDGQSWQYRIELFEPDQVTENCFPDEQYHLEDMGERFRGIAAYADGKPAGYAIVYEEWNQWLYIDNLLVTSGYRRAGIGTALMDASLELAEKMQKLGVWLVCQDNNLQAMRFYLQNGFELGGMHLPVYEGTKQEGKADLYLYKRVK